MKFNLLFWQKSLLFFMAFFLLLEGEKNQRLVDMMLVVLYKINNKISHLTYYVGLILHPVI